MKSSKHADEAEKLLLAMARGLHAVGIPSHRLEETLNDAAEKLGVPLTVLAMPTAVILSLDGATGPRNHILRMRPGGVNLERLSQLSAVAKDVIRGSLAPALATQRIQSILHQPDRWRWPATVSAYVLSGGAFAVFFRGGWNETIVAMVEGLVVGLLALLMHRGRTVTRIFELVAAAAAALVAGLADTFIGSFVEWVPLAAGLIILLPGIALVDAVEELAHGHLVSGGARLAGVGVVFLALTFGAVAGSVLAKVLPGPTAAVSTTPLPDWAVVVALVAVTVGSTIRFRAYPADLGVVFLASTLALSASRFASEQIGALAGPFLAALALGLGANAYARLRGQAAERFTIPGLAVLVPGSVGLRSVGALLSHDSNEGVDAAFQMFLIAMALVAGLLFSNALLRDAPGD